MGDIGENVSKNLRELRKIRQLTLEELAEKSGVSKSMLGEIERGRTTPTITVLWKITQALKTPLTSLLDDRNASYTLVRKSDQIPLDKDPNHEISSIFPFYEPHRLEFLNLTLAPLSMLNSPGHMKGVEEYLTVVEGAVTLTVNGEEVMLQTQDSIRFAADTAHAIENRSDHQARLLNIIHYA